MDAEGDDLRVAWTAALPNVTGGIWSPNTLHLVKLDEHRKLDVHHGRDALARSDSFATAWAPDLVLPLLRKGQHQE